MVGHEFPFAQSLIVKVRDKEPNDQSVADFHVIIINLLVNGRIQADGGPKAVRGVDHPSSSIISYNQRDCIATLGRSVNSISTLKTRQDGYARRERLLSGVLSWSWYQLMSHFCPMKGWDGK